MAIEAKYLRPRLDHVTLRPEARDALAAAFGRRLTVICAPAGYGKTTTTAAALELCGRQAAWYKLDILDHDPLAFLAAMTRAVQRLQPGFGAALLQELESGPVLDVPPLALAARFCSECDRTLIGPGHLVLDDYHETMDAPAMNEVLGYLLDNCPDIIRFVVLTRYEPAFRLEKLRLAGEVARIPRDLLLFDAGQVAEVLYQRSGQRHDPEHVARLLALTEGWPASVVLAGMALEWLDAESLEGALSDPRLRGDVFSYLAEQVFQRQTEEVQRFLLRTCCLDHVNGDLAERLTGERTASRHLHFLARNHVFTFETSRQGTYRYHNLLRDFLRQRFVQDEGEHAFRALQRETAVALEACGDRPGAVELLLDANELDLALGVVARGGEAELERLPYEQLRLWATKVSPASNEEHPWALITSAVLDIRVSQFTRGLADLRRAAAAVRDNNDRDGLYQTLSIIEWAEFWSGDSAASMATCNRALKYASTDAQRLHTLLSLMSAALDMRRWSEMTSASKRASALLRHASPEEEARARALSAHAAFYQGDMRAARRLVRESPAPQETAAQRAAELNTHGMIDIALADYESAKQNLQAAAALADQLGHALTSYMIEDNLAMLEAATGAPDVALRRLHELRRHEDELDPSILCYVLTHQGTVLRRRNAIRDGIEPTGRAAQVMSRERDPYLALNAAVNLALAEALLGEDRRSTLLKLSSDGAAAGLPFIELKALLFVGIVSAVMGDKREAVRALEQCLPQQLSLGHVGLLAQDLCPRPDLAALVLRRHKSNGLGPALVDALSRHWQFADVAPTLAELCPSQARTWIDHVVMGHSPAAAREAVTSGRERRASSSAATSLGDLTPREREVLQLMAEDRSNEEIAGDLFISIPTVKTHVNHILRKLGQKKRIGAVLEYQRMTGPAQGRHARRDHPHLNPPR